MFKETNPAKKPPVPYDQRSGRFVNMGDNYGVGMKQPVGHEGNPKERAQTMPMECKSEKVR